MTEQQPTPDTTAPAPEGAQEAPAAPPAADDPTGTPTAPETALQAPEPHTPRQRPVGALAIRDEQEDWTPAQRAALVQIGLADAPREDLTVFLSYAQRTGLDPFARQLYMIARWDNRTGRNKYTIQASIDAFRIVAQRSGEYAGQKGPQWCGPDGQWRDVWLEATPPAAARVGAYRRGFVEPVWGIALWKEYAQTVGRDGKLSPMWERMGTLMLAKCAEALALRKAFPHDLSGLYTSDEMGQADSAAAVPSTTPDEQPAEPPGGWSEHQEEDAQEVAVIGSELRGQPDKIRGLWQDAKERGLLQVPVVVDGRSGALGAALTYLASIPPIATGGEVVEGTVVDEQPAPADRVAAPEGATLCDHRSQAGRECIREAGHEGRHGYRLAARADDAADGR